MLIVRRWASRLSCLLFLLLQPDRVSGDTAFALELETCIREHAVRLAQSFPTWGNSCLPPTAKIDVQAKMCAMPLFHIRPTLTLATPYYRYEETLSPIYEKHGYQAALWCAMYSLGMTGAEYDPKDTQPNNPNFSDW